MEGIGEENSTNVIVILDEVEYSLFSLIHVLFSKSNAGASCA
jgi:hypothetical protein